MNEQYKKKLIVLDTHCVEALEKVFGGQLTPAVLHIHAPIKLSIFTTYKTKLLRSVVAKIYKKKKKNTVSVSDYL